MKSLWREGLIVPEIFLFLLGLFLPESFLITHPTETTGIVWLPVLKQYNFLLRLLRVLHPFWEEGPQEEWYNDSYYDCFQHDCKILFLQI